MGQFMEPLQLIYSWQAICVAAAASGLTHLIKTVLDLRMGQEARRANLVLTRLVLPMVPILAGALTALVIPVRPDFLYTYIHANVPTKVGAYSAFGLWGGVCGMFADYTFTKVKSFMLHSNSRCSIPPESRP